MSKPLPPQPIPDTLCEDIFEQVVVWRETLRELPERLAQLRYPDPGTQCLVGIAEGSSAHALAMAQPFIESWTDTPLRVLNPNALASELLVLKGTIGGKGLFHDSFFMMVSQSGETASVLSVLETLKCTLKEGGYPEPYPFLTLTNTPGSTLANTYQNNLPIQAGKENYIAATKTMTTSFLCLLGWALSWGRHLGRIHPEAEGVLWEQLHNLPETLERLLHRKRPLNRILAFTRKLTEVNHFILLSKGPYALMLPEAGLKLIETSSNIVYTDNTESFKHGPKVMLSGIQGHPPNSIYLVPPDLTLAEEVFQDLKTHFALKDHSLGFSTERLFLMTFENGPAIPEELYQDLQLDDDHILVLPAVETLIQGLLIGLVAFQMISFFLAWLKGESPDNPALQKAVVD